LYLDEPLYAARAVDQVLADHQGRQVGHDVRGALVPVQVADE